MEADNSVELSPHFYYLPWYYGMHLKSGHGNNKFFSLKHSRDLNSAKYIHQNPPIKFPLLWFITGICRSNFVTYLLPF